ncbi:MAG: hypothetical protein EA363_01030 [Balneolaceae bacterium]|nr:MAG: hypothetical protein EA363_01030 [Balneolaceae bacterium]
MTENQVTLQNRMTEVQITLQNRFHFNGLKDSTESAALTNIIHNLLLFFEGFCFLLRVWMDFRSIFECCRRFLCL